MGIKIKELWEGNENIKTIATLKNLQQKRIAFDAFNVIYSFLSTIRESTTFDVMRNLKGEVTSHLVGLWNRNKILLDANIKPIYVFDGPPSARKSKELKRRREIKIDARHKYEEAYDSGDREEMAKQSRRMPKLTAKMIQSSKELLSAMGIPYMESPQEAEAQCAYLVDKNAVWAAGTQDYDAFLFGSKRIIRNLSSSRYRTVKGKKITNDIEIYFINNVFSELGLTQNQMVDMGILIGVDFYDGISGVGAKTAYKLIKEHGDLETIIKKGIMIKGKQIHIDACDIADVREIFLNPVVETEIPNFKWRRPKANELRRILIEENDFNADKTGAQIKEFAESPAKKIQMSLDSFTKRDK